MSNERIQVDFNDMEEAERLFKDCARACEDLGSQVKGWCTTLNEGALLGEPGEALADALGTVLFSACNRLGDKMDEEANTVQQAAQTVRDDMSESSGYFNI